LRDNPNIRYYSAVEARAVEWLWYPYIPYGRITVIQGDPGDGKTTLALNIAANLSTGMSFPESDSPVVEQNVIYQSTEDGIADTMKPRLISAGADCTRIAFVDDTLNPLTLDDERLESAIAMSGARLLVLDPLQAFIGTNTDLHRAGDMRPLLHKLAAIAEKTMCAVVIIGHMNKASGAKGLYRGLGSIDITAVARSVLLVGRLKDEPTIRVMTHLKSSLAPEGPSVAFELATEGGFRWIGRYDITTDDLLSGAQPVEPSKVEQGAALLTQLLEAGPAPCIQAYAHLKKYGISERTADAAKRMANVTSKKIAGGWYWSL
jgi:hypothetical protein